MACCIVAVQHNTVQLSIWLQYVSDGENEGSDSAVLILAEIPLQEQDWIKP